MAIIRTPIVDDDGSGQTGTVLNNAWKQELYDQIDASVVSALQAYTPGWRSTVAPDPVLGNGTLTGRYMPLGDYVFVLLRLVFGTTTTPGGGPWVFTMPGTMVGGPMLSAGLSIQGGAYPLVGSGVVTATEIYPFAGPAGSLAVAMDATHPTTWAAGHTLDWQLIYTKA